MIRKSSFLALFVTLFFSFFVISTADAVTETFSGSYQVEPGTKLELHNENGKVPIKRWDQSHVKVTAKKKTGRGGKLENVEIKVTQAGTMNIETIHLVKNPRVSVTYDVRVPAEVIVNYVDTSNGGIKLEGTKGNAIVETSNGKIEIENVSGNIRARTSNGKIKMKDIDGYVSAETSNGSIEVKKVAGIEKAETSNGSIEAEIPAIHDNDIRIKTSNGFIKLYLSPDLDANIEMRTSNGKIIIRDLEIVASEISKTKLKGRIGNGGRKIYGKTSNGSINLHRLK